MSDAAPAHVRLPVHTAHDEATPTNGFSQGERRLWLAVVDRAVRDAKGLRLGSDPKTGNNRVRAEARRWFREREITVGGWGWIIDACGLTPDYVDRLEREALRGVRRGR